MLDEKFYIKEYVRFREYYNVMLQWVLLLQKGIKIDEFLKSRGYSKIVIYGMSDIGNCLVSEIKKGCNCEILYTIDQGNPKLYYNVPCYKLKDLWNLEKPDIIVVTIPYLYDQIKDDITRIGDYMTISITELVYDAYYNVEKE